MRLFIIGFIVALIAAILIGCIIGMVYFHNENHVDKPSHTEIHNHNYYDTTVHQITINNHTLQPVQSIPQPIPQKVDSAEVARLYYAENIYTQESADSNVHISITDTIARNMIKGRKLTYKLIRPVKIEQTVINEYASKKKFGLFAGIHGGCSTTGIRSIGPEALIIYKDARAYSLNYNLIDKSINAGLLWKIGKK